LRGNRCARVPPQAAIDTQSGRQRPRPIWRGVIRSAGRREILAVSVPHNPVSPAFVDTSKRCAGVRAYRRGEPRRKNRKHAARTAPYLSIIRAARRETDPQIQ